MRYYIKILLLFSLIVNFLSNSVFASATPSPCNNNKMYFSLIDQLNSDNFHSRIAAFQQLISFGPDIVPCLSELLLNENESIACSSANILGELGIDGLNGLISFLKNEQYLYLNLPRHQCVLDSLFRIGPTVIPDILEMCVSYDDDYHPMTFGKLSNFINKFNKSATPFLIETIKKGNPKLKHLSLLILKKINDERSIPTAIELLNNENRAVQIEAAWTLGFMGRNAKPALEHLKKLLNSADQKTVELETPFKFFKYKSLKSEIFEVIIKIDNEKRTLAFDDVMPLVNDKDPFVRKLSLVYLNNSKIDKKLILDILLKKLKDFDANVRAQAAKFLENIDEKDGRIIQSLVESLSDPSGIVRKESLSTLFKINKSSDFKRNFIIKFMDDDDPIVQKRAIEEISRLKSDATSLSDKLIIKTKSNNDDVIREALKQLGKLDTPNDSSVKAIIACLDSRNTTVISSAIDAIKNIGSFADEAIIPLKKIILDNQLSLRSSAFNALQSIGSKSSEVLLILLLDNNPDIREQSAKAIGNIKPKIHSTVPSLLEAFRKDKDLKVRQAAAISLGKIGAVGDEAISYICSALNDSNYSDLVSALQAIRSIGSQAECAIPKLIALLEVQNVKIKNEVIKTIAIFGPDASEALPKLISIIDKKNILCFNDTLEAIGQMGPPAPEVVPVLIDLLKNDDLKNYREKTISTFGQLGYLSAPAITTILEILNESSPNYKEVCIEALVRIVTDARDNGVIELLDKIIIIEQNLKSYPDFSSSKFEKGEHLKIIARAREYLELSVKEPLTDRVASFHSKIPWSVIAIEVIIVLYLIWIFILYILVGLWPKLIPKIHNSFSGIDLEIKYKNLKTEIPLRKFLFLNAILGNNRVLNSWIKRNLPNAINNFSEKETVKQRETHVDLPVNLNGKILEKISAKDIKDAFKTEIFCLMIQGEGGAGKTHLACQVGKWCMNKYKDLRIFNHIAIPIIIEDDIPHSDDPHSTLMNHISTQLRLIIGSSQKVPYPLLVKLLEKKRVIVVIDHLSEMGESTISAFNTIFQEAIINALIVTSRIEEKLGGLSRISLNPLRLKKGHLRHFFDAYFRACNQIDLFDDREFGNLLDRLSTMVGERDITILMCELYAKQLIAFKNGDFDDLPKNIPELMLQYLNELNRNVTRSDRIPDRDVHSYAKTIAWLAINQNFKSSYVSDELIFAHFRAQDAKKIIDYLVLRLRIIKISEPTKDKIRFVLDPIAEYLSGIYIVETFQAEDWDNLTDRLNKTNDEIKKASGFINALIDCCKAELTTKEIPEHVIEALSQIESRINLL